MTEALPEARINRIKVRLYWADLCRVIAIFAVILLHVSAKYFYDMTPLDNWLISNFIDSSVRFCVPLFVMLSGALLLVRPFNSETEISSLIKRCLKVALPFIVWSIIYLFETGNTNFLSVLYKPSRYHLWFCYMILGLYLFYPLLKGAYELIKDRHDFCAYLFVVWVLFIVFPTLFGSPVSDTFHLGKFILYSGYFLIGGISRHWIQMKQGGVRRWFSCTFVLC